MDLSRRGLIAATGGLAVSGGARALPLLIGQPRFPLMLDFMDDVYVHDGASIGPLSGFATETRSTAANMDDVSGLWTPFKANVARRSNKGLRAETARTNICLWNRDQTQAAWIKAGITAAKDQIGIDGGTNAASSLTATAARGTSLQSIANASSARVQSAFVRRLAGSGPIAMTMDGGTTWAAIPVTSTWTQVKIPAQTLTDPVVGFRVATAGDAIAVDAVQNENDNTGDYATAPIFTTSKPVERDIDLLKITSPSTFADVFQQPQLTVMLEFARFTVAVGGNLFSISDGTLDNRYTYNFNNATSEDGLSGITIAASGKIGGYDPLQKKVDKPGKVYRFAAATDQGANRVCVALNGATESYNRTAWPVPAGFDTIEIGELNNAGPMCAYLRKLWATPKFHGASTLAKLTSV